MIRTTLAAVLAAAALLSVGCTGTTQFSGAFFYGNLVGEREGDALRSEAFDQLVRRARTVGLAPAERTPTRLVFRTQAPNWMGVDADGQPVERIDTRVLTVEVRAGEAANRETYRYIARLSGSEPGGFTDQARAELAAAMLAARELFETPLATDFFAETAPATAAQESN